MKHLFIVLLCNLTAIICAVLSGYLAYHGVNGWGWFLVVALFATYHAELKEN